MFSDIAHHWARGCIIALAKQGLVGGYPNGTFRPLAVVSRAEFAVLMRRAFPDLPIKRSLEGSIERPSPLSDSLADSQFGRQFDGQFGGQLGGPFADVPSQYWASQAITWTFERALFSGDQSGRFLPRQSISRVQAVVVLMAALSAEQSSEAASLADINSAKQQVEQLIDQTFTDAAAVPNYGRSAVSRAIAAGLFESLLEPRALLPNQSLTRGEAAALLCRALDISPIAQTGPVLTKALTRDRKARFEQFMQQEAGFGAEKLAFLDLGIRTSPFRHQRSRAALSLQQAEPKVAIPLSLTNAAPYPSRGDRPEMDATGLDFLAAEMLSACVCVSTTESGQLSARWLGREAFINRQMWSATKFIPLLYLIDQANRIAPREPIENYIIRRAGATAGFPFSELASGIMSYDNRIATSNSLSAMFKRFTTPAALEKWTRQLTGNQKLSFQGRYGEIPFMEYPELWDAKARKAVIKSPGQAHRGQNLVSTYDLTRLITMLGWHWRLPRRAIVPNVQGHSLSSLIQAMGVDTARYVDVALETLELTNLVRSDLVRSPVILSKSGFGRSDQRDRTELTYCALAEFDLPRVGASDPTASHQHYVIAMTLIAAQRTGDGNQEARFVDALMAAEVTEIIRRLVLGKL